MVEVRVQVSGDQATVAFTAHNQQARDALENASQRLRDLLGSQGFVNVQVDKKELGRLVNGLAERSPKVEVAATLDALKDLGFHWATRTSITTPT